MRVPALCALTLALGACAGGRVLRADEAPQAGESVLEADAGVLVAVRMAFRSKSGIDVARDSPTRLRLAPGWYDLDFSCIDLGDTILVYSLPTTKLLHVRAGRRYRVACSTRKFGKLLVTGEGAVGDSDARVSCTAGPIATDFGGLPWLAFACDDGRSVALVSAPGNIAAPFSFVVRPSDNGVRVQGDGAGDRGATAAAFAQLMALDDAALLRLFERAMLAPGPDGN
jgi:hypothetical protein